MSIVSSEEIELESDLSLKEAKAIRAALPFSLSIRAVIILWTVFSNDQAANRLIIDNDTLERFKVWIETGDPDDAWS